MNMAVFDPVIFVLVITTIMAWTVVTAFITFTKILVNNHNFS